MVIEQRGAIWARVSTVGQHETSIPSQIERSKDKAESMGYVIPADFILATDKSSLQLKDDSQFLKLYDLVIKHKISAIFLLDRDRLSAEPLERLSFISLCKENGVTIIPAQGPELLDSDEGQLVEMALALGKKKAVLRAQLGSKQGLYDRVKLYHFPVTFRNPYGYQWEGKTTEDKERELTLTPDDNWQNVKLIFDQLLEGIGYEHIIQELQRRGIPSPAGQLVWNKTALSNLIHNPLYGGRYYSLKKETVIPKKRKTESNGKSSLIKKPSTEWVYLDRVKVINPPVTWEHRQKILDQIVSHMNLSKRNANVDYLLRGFISCNEHYGKGGKPRTYHGTPRRDKYYYCCPVSGCKNRYMPGPEFETYVKTRIAVLLSSQPEEFFKQPDAKSLIDKKKLIENELIELQKKHDRIIDKQAKVEDDYYSNKFSQEVYSRLRDKYQFEQQGIENKRNELLNDLSQLNRQRDAVESLVKLKEKYIGVLFGAAEDKDSARFEIENIYLTNEQWREIFSTLNMQIRTTTAAEREDRIRSWLSAEYDWITFDQNKLEIKLADTKFNPLFDTVIKIGIPLEPIWLMEGIEGQVPDKAKQKIHGVVTGDNSIDSANPGIDKPNRATYPIYLTP